MEKCGQTGNVPICPICLMIKEVEGIKPTLGEKIFIAVYYGRLQRGYSWLYY
jgi:hypothetical protein